MFFDLAWLPLYHKSMQCSKDNSVETDKRVKNQILRFAKRINWLDYKNTSQIQEIYGKSTLKVKPFHSSGLQNGDTSDIRINSSLVPAASFRSLNLLISLIWSLFHLPRWEPKPDFVVNPGVAKPRTCWWTSVKVFWNEVSTKWQFWWQN